MSAEGQRIYVYGVVGLDSTGTMSGMPRVSGLAGVSIRAIAGDGLAAIASTLALSSAGAPFEEELKDPERAKVLILDHHRVLRQTIDEHTVLPMRFGMLFRDDGSVADALLRNRSALADALRYVEGAREWGVKIFCDRAVASRGLGATSPAVLAAESELSQAATGRAFFLRRRLARLREEEAERTLAQEVEANWQSLCGAARAAAAMKLQPASIHGRTGEMVRNGALLVRRDAEGRFLSLVEKLAQADAGKGLHYEVTGPWAPFSFVDCRLEGAGNARPDGE